jgi:hypothetical protein
MIRGVLTGGSIADAAATGKWECVARRVVAAIFRIEQLKFFVIHIDVREA